jgi:hypothetical protein
MGGHIAQAEFRVLQAGALVAENEGRRTGPFRQKRGGFAWGKGMSLAAATGTPGNADYHGTAGKRLVQAGEDFRLFPDAHGVYRAGCDNGPVETDSGGRDYPQAGKPHVRHCPANRPDIAAFPGPGKDDNHFR